MTNYNERLDEILQKFALNQQLIGDQYGRDQINELSFELKDSEYRDEAKQAFTSLIKELVADAKPDKRELIEPITGKPVSRGDKVTVDVEADPRGSLIFVQNNGYNMALNQFEQNLLKALEEV